MVKLAEVEHNARSDDICIEADRQEMAEVYSAIDLLFNMTRSARDNLCIGQYGIAAENLNAIEDQLVRLRSIIDGHY